MDRSTVFRPHGPRHRGIRRRQTQTALLFISPWIIGLFLFFLRPLFTSLRLSFGTLTSIVGLQTQWAGFANYIRAFTVDVEFVPLLLGQIRTTLIYTPLITVFSLLLALLLNRKVRFKGVFRCLFFLPVLLGSGVVMQELQKTGVHTGAITEAASVLLPPSLSAYFGAGFSDTMTVLFGSINDILWKCGVQTVLFLAGLQTISPSLYESAKCDAATGWESFWFITLPMMLPIILLNLIYTLIDSFGDINNAVMAYILRMKTEMDYAAAIGWIYFIFIFLLTALIYLLLGRRVYADKER